MSHIELTECAFFKKNVFEKNRKMKQEWYSNQQKVRNFVDYGRTAGDFGNNSPNPFLIAPGKLVRGPDGVILVTSEDQAAKNKVARDHENIAREQAAREQAAQFQAALVQVPQRTGYSSHYEGTSNFEDDEEGGVKFEDEDEDDLISFIDVGPPHREQNESSEQATTSGSSTPVASAFMFSQVDFPALTAAPKNAAQQSNLPAPKPAIEAADFPPLVPQKVVKTTNTEAKVASAWGPKHLATVNPAAVTPAGSMTGNASGSKQKSFPTTPAALDPTGISAVDSKAGSVWDATQKLFSDAPPAISPPAEFLQALTLKSSKEEEDEDPLDPNSKSFNAKKFYIEFIGKFRCPHRGCSKTIQSSSAFIQHLKSPAHRNEKLQCINCLRYFATATALTQHCESQGVRCKVRQTSEYDGVVDSVTGGTAITAGRHIDDTIRYAVNPSITVTGVVDTHRALMEEKNRVKNTFWDKKTPRW